MLDALRPVAPPAMWDSVPRVALVHAVLRRRLLSAGAADAWFDAPHGVRAHGYLAGRGTGKDPVVLVHGLGDSAHTWFRTLPRLVAEGHPVLALDLYGHGYTPLPEGRSSLRIPEQGALVAAVAAQAFEDRPFALVGHSLGGWVAIKLAAEGRAPLTRLVLVESAGLPYDGMEREIALLRVQSAADVQRLWSSACHRVPWELRLFQSDVARLFALPVVKEFVERAPMEDALTDDEVRAVRVPTTLIWGENDGLVPPEVGSRLYSLLPRGAIRWIPHCGHAPQLEAPRVFHEHLVRALAAGPQT